MSQQSTHQEDCTMKVTVPVSLRMKLHILKILEGQNLSETVELALENYFEDSGIDEMEFPGEESNLIGLGAPRKPKEEA